MSNELLKKFKAVKNFEGRINPDRSWVAKNKANLMNQIGNTIESEEKYSFNMNTLWQGLQILIPGKIVYSLVRPVVVFLLVFSIAASGWITTVGATQDTLPGDFAYGVKVAVSKLTKDNIEVATDISKDVKKVAAKKEQDTPKKVAVGVEYLKKSLDDAKEEVKRAAVDQPESTVEKAKQMTDAVKDINQNLTDAKEEVKSNVTEGSDEAVAGVDEAKLLASGSALEVVDDVVQKKVDGTLNASDEDVKDMISNQIEIALGDANDLAKDTTDVAQVVSTTLPVVIVSTSTVIDSSVTSSKDTLFGDGVVVDVKTVVNETIKKMTETGEGVQKDLADAKTLVNNNQLLEAMEKVKAVTITNNEIKINVEQVKQSVIQTVKDTSMVVPVPVVDPNTVKSIPVLTPEVATTSITNPVSVVNK